MEETPTPEETEDFQAEPADDQDGSEEDDEFQDEEWAEGEDSFGSDSDGPRVLDPRADSGRELDKTDVFKNEREWVQDRFDVASEQDIRGLSTIVERCDLEEGSMLEYRLANGFKNFSFSAGQANDSESSDQGLKIEVYANGRQIDSQVISFNKIADLSYDVDGVNALQVYLYKEEGDDWCSGRDSVRAVLYKMRLQ